MQIEKFTNCSLQFETSDGSKGTINIPNICSGDISIRGDEYGGASTIDISLNAFKNFEDGELFNIVIDQDEKENEEESEGEAEDMARFYYTVVSCIFPSDKDKYYSDSKVYNYIIDEPPDNCSIKKNTLFQVFDKQRKVKYGGAELLCIDAVGFKCIRDIQDYYNRIPYTIPIYEVCGQLNVDELESSNEASFKREYEGEFSQEAMNSFVSQIDKALNSFASQYGFIQHNNEGTAIGNGIIGTYEGTPITSDIIGKRSEISYDEAYAAVGQMIEDNKENINTLITEEEKSMFDKIMKNIEFGKVNTSDLAYTFNGICFRDADGNYTSLNPDGTFTNVYDMVMDIPIYVMPVGKDQIKVGDIIKYFDKWVMIAQIDNTTITTIDPWTREIRVIIPEKSVFGFDYYTKVIDIFSGININADSSNPFGIMLPFMMMSDKSDIDPMMLMMMMNGQNLNGMNPMMMYMMMSKDSTAGGKDNMLPLMMMMNSGMFGGNSCNCGNGCKCDNTATESTPYTFYYDTGAAAENSGDDSQNSKED